MVNFGPLTAEIGSGVWCTPANFNWFRVLAALLHAVHGIYSSGRQLNFSALNKGRHLCSAGRPSRWALAHILVSYCCHKAYDVPILRVGFLLLIGQRCSLVARIVQSCNLSPPRRVVCTLPQITFMQFGIKQFIGLHA